LAQGPLKAELAEVRAANDDLRKRHDALHDAFEEDERDQIDALGEECLAAEEARDLQRIAAEAEERKRAQAEGLRDEATASLEELKLVAEAMAQAAKIAGAEADEQTERAESELKAAREQANKLWGKAAAALDELNKTVQESSDALKALEETEAQNAAISAAMTARADAFAAETKVDTLNELIIAQGQRASIEDGLKKEQEAKAAEDLNLKAATAEHAKVKAHEDAMIADLDEQVALDQANSARANAIADKIAAEVARDKGLGATPQEPQKRVDLAAAEVIHQTKIAELAELNMQLRHTQRSLAARQRDLKKATEEHDELTKIYPTPAANSAEEKDILRALARKTAMTQAEADLTVRAQSLVLNRDAKLLEVSAAKNEVALKQAAL
jgi:hypothetical protein